MRMILISLAFSSGFVAAADTRTQGKLPEANKQKWYQDTSVGLGLDFRRQNEINTNESNFKTHYVLHGDRLWKETWLGGFQYAYSQDDSSSGAIKVKQQNHELLLRGQGRLLPLQGGAFWGGLGLGYEKSRTQLGLGDDHQTRWSDWTWVFAPEISYRHRLYNNFWMQEVVSYVERQYHEEGEWNFALRVGADLSVY